MLPCLCERAKAAEDVERGDGPVLPVIAVEAEDEVGCLGAGDGAQHVPEEVTAPEFGGNDMGAESRVLGDATGYVPCLMRHVFDVDHALKLKCSRRKGVIKH